MARGSQLNETNGETVYAKIKGLKKGEQVHIELARPNPNDKKNPTKEANEQKITGYLIKAEHRVFQYEGKDADSIKLFLNDPAVGEKGETIILDLGMSNMTRSIMNSLLGIPSFVPEISISVWNNEKGFASVSVRSGGEKTSWKFTLDDFNAKITKDKVKQKNPKTGKVEEVEQNNYIELNDFLIKEFKEFVIPNIEASKKEAKAAGATKAIFKPLDKEGTGVWPESTSASDGPQDDSDDSDKSKLPF